MTGGSRGTASILRLVSLVLVLVGSGSVASSRMEEARETGPCTAQDGATPPSSWRNRPTALTREVNPYTLASSRDALERHYDTDNRAAAGRGVRILSRQASTKVRTLQWNVNNGWYNYDGAASRRATRRGILDAIREADADVLVLNEYYRELALGDESLRDMGYHHVQVATVACPTALVSRLKVDERREVILSRERSALLAKVRVGTAEDGEDEYVWVIGTHVNFMRGPQRRDEIDVLLRELKWMGLIEGGEDACGAHTNYPIVLVGDLNQQRERDYAPQEWERILSGMKLRHSTPDDGVADMLEEAGFTCAFDCKSGEVETNWGGPHPPATHWSGTIVDYSYGRNAKPTSISIGSAPWSDHRMTACDWTWQ